MSLSEQEKQATNPQSKIHHPEAKPGPPSPTRARTTIPRLRFADAPADLEAAINNRVVSQSRSHGANPK
jgi:hypothetical protein